MREDMEHGQYLSMGGARHGLVERKGTNGVPHSCVSVTVRSDAVNGGKPTTDYHMNENDDDNDDVNDNDNDNDIHHDRKVCVGLGIWECFGTMVSYCFC